MEKFLQWVLNPLLRKRRKTCILIWRGRGKKT